MKALLTDKLFVPLFFLPIALIQGPFYPFLTVFFLYKFPWRSETEVKKLCIQGTDI